MIAFVLIRVGLDRAVKRQSVKRASGAGQVKSGTGTSMGLARRSFVFPQLRAMAETCCGS